MKRLIFLAPSMEQAKTVVAGLHQLSVDDEQIHVLAKDHDLLQKEHLHEATELETTELEQDMDWGMVAGGTMGLLAGLAVTGMGPFGLILGGGSALAGSLLGVGLGGWLGAMIGESTPTAAVEKYEHAIDSGQLLMMVDVDAEQMPPAWKLIRETCPQALVEANHLTHDHQLVA